MQATLRGSIASVPLCPLPVLTRAVLQDKGVSTLLKEYMRTLNLSMGKRKRSSSGCESKYARQYSPSDPMWAPGCGPRQSPPTSPSAAGSNGHLAASPLRSLPGRCRRKTLRLAEADDLDKEDLSSEGEEEDEDEEGAAGPQGPADQGRLAGATPPLLRPVQVGGRFKLCHSSWA